MVDEREVLWAIADAAEAYLGGAVDTNAESAGRRDNLSALLMQLRGIQSAANESTSVPAHSRPCERCGAQIFFARTVANRWMPLELDQVSVDGMLPAWKYHVTFGTGEPRVFSQPQLKTGMVWVNHIITCGLGPGPQHRIPVLQRRYEANSLRSQATVDEVRQSLIAMERRLAADDADTRRHD